jgi:hypothetical protein
VVKFAIHFFRPSDAEAFEIGYNEFLALIERMPNVQRRQVVNVLGSPRGDSPLYRILEVYFEDYAGMQASLNTFQGQEAGGHLNTFPKSSFEMIFAEVYEETGGHTPSVSIQSSNTP